MSPSIDSNKEPIVAMRDIVKEFPGVRALDRVSFALYAGEVHALVGENGAGKSTLIKTLAGVHRPESGEIYMDGRQVHLDSARDSLKHRIGVVYQEFNLVPDQSVLENMMLGAEPVKTVLKLVNRRLMRERVAEVLKEINVELDPHATLRSLGVGKQQLVEICRVLLSEPRVVVMDEPTAALTSEEINELFSLVQKLKGRGVAIIYISHRLEEIFQIADRVTVLRDGRTVQSHNVAEVDRDLLVREMTGRVVEAFFPRREEAPSDEELLRVEGLKNQSLNGISLTLRKGEILGLYGMMGSGRTELLRAIFGADPVVDGSLWIEGQKVRIKHPSDAIRYGMCLLAEDRKAEGLFLDLSLSHNVSIATINRYTHRGVVNRREEARDVERHVRRLNVKAPSVSAVIRNLSGGNQQKALFGRWLNTRPRILLLDEPTRGIDVGAKVEVFQLMVELAREGYAILFVSSELPEIIAMSDRVLVLKHGAVVQELSDNDITEEHVLQHAV